MTFEEQKDCPMKLECPICGHNMHFYIDKEQTLADIDKWFNLRMECEKELGL